MKNKQKSEIVKLLESETKVEKIRRENDEKDNNEHIREEQILRNAIEKQKRQEEFILKKEKYKQDLLKMEITEQQNRNLTRFLESQKKEEKTKNNENLQDGDEDIIENFLKQDNNRLKQAFSLESNLIEQQKKTIERQRMMMERDKIRKDCFLQKKLETKIDSLKFKEFTQRKIAFAKNQFDVKIMHQKHVNFN